MLQKCLNVSKNIRNLMTTGNLLISELVNKINNIKYILFLLILISSPKKHVSVVLLLAYKHVFCASFPANGKILFDFILLIK